MLKVISAAALTALIGVILLGPVAEYVFRDIRAEKAFEHNEQGLSYLTDTSASQAIRSFKNAIALDPLEAAYHLNLAVVYENFPAVATQIGETGRQEIYRNIMRELLTVKMLSPNDMDAAFGYAVRFASAPSFGVAPNWEIGFRAWEDYLALAERDYKRKPTLEADGHRLRGLMELARIEIRTGSPGRAIAHLRKAQEIKPESPIIEMLLAKATKELTESGKPSLRIDANTDGPEPNYLLAMYSTTDKKMCSETS